MIRRLLTITPYRRGWDCCETWLAVAPARVDGYLVGVSLSIGDWSLMIDVPSRVNLALAVRECDCDDADIED